MERFHDSPKIQEVGSKMLRRIEMSMDEEFTVLSKEKEERIEKAKLKIISENEDELNQLQKNLDEAMAKEEAVMNEQLEKRKAEILDLKKQNLDDRLRMAQGEMSDQQVTELRDQYDKEFENLDTAIKDEKTKQLGSMRSALLQRKIDKERKRKEKEAAEAEKKRREQVQKMNTAMAKAFTEMLAVKQKAMKADKLMASKQGKDRLKAKLQAWQKNVDGGRADRGGEEGEVWNLQTREEEHEAEAKAAGVTLQESTSAESIDYTVNELYARILRVENLVDKVKDFGGVDMQDLYESLDSMSQTLSRHMSMNSRRF